MSNEKSSVFLVAGNRIIREGLARLLGRKGFSLSGFTASVADCNSVAVASGDEVLVPDSVSARLSGWSFISDMISLAPNMKVVLIDMENDREIFLECVRAGAVGYILKDASAAEVVSGVHAVAQGQAVCPPELCMHLFHAFSRQWTAIPSARFRIEFGLTRRQQQIVPMIAQGLTNKEIASNLNLSEQTVKNHVHGIMRRVGADDRLPVIDVTRLSDEFH